MNILADSSLPGLDQAFPKPFHITRYNHPGEIIKLIPEKDILFCRSTLKVNEALLKNHSLRYVATASSGIDHLDYCWLASQNIQIIDAKGANAPAVADYVIACLAFLTKQHLIKGNKVGIIGLGKVGTQVAARLKATNFQIVTFDPLKTAQKHSNFKSCLLEDLYEVDILCIHAQLHTTEPYPSFNLINKHFLNQLKPGCIIINAARGGIVNEYDLYNLKKPLIYCTDVYLNEPTPDKRIIDKAVLCTPHIAGHSIEAKYAAVALVSEQLHQIANRPVPQFERPKLPHTLNLTKSTSWDEVALQIYNPFEETFELKQALNKEDAFLRLRKNHQHRHNFSLYFPDALLNDKNRSFLLDPLVFLS